jgi:hypothetical protein
MVLNLRWIGKEKGAVRGAALSGISYWLLVIGARATRLPLQAIGDQRLAEFEEEEDLNS